MYIKMLPYLCVLGILPSSASEIIEVEVDVNNVKVNANAADTIRAEHCEDKATESPYVLPDLGNIDGTSSKERDIVVPASVCHIDAHNSADKISAILSCLEQSDKEWLKI